MKAALVLAAPLLAVGLLALASAEPSVAQERREAADRQSRQESDGIRAEMRQHRLKRLKSLDNTGQLPKQGTTKPKPQN